MLAALKALSTNPLLDPTTGQIDLDEQSRLLLLKTANGMIGNWELSGQQVSLFLCNIPNRFTNHVFDTVWWSSIVRTLTGNLLKGSPHPEEVENIIETDITQSNSNEIDFDSDGYMLLGNVSCGSKTGTMPVCTTLIHDVFYRPSELHDCSLWELFRNYKIDKLPKDFEEKNSNLSSGSFCFDSKHPKYHSHYLCKRPCPITPVLIGCPISNRDSLESEDLYAACMLILFKPWNATFLNFLNVNLHLDLMHFVNSPLQ